MRVLVIDDDAVIRAVCRGLLESRGIEVIEHDSAFGAESLVLEQKPDVVLLDLEMPGMRGDQIVGDFSRHVDESDLPLVVFYSGRELEELDQLVESTGADGAISKSSRPSAFLAEFEAMMIRLGKPIG